MRTICAERIPLLFVGVGTHDGVACQWVCLFRFVLGSEHMGGSHPKASGMMCGDFTNLSERKLMDCLNRLGYDIEI